MLTVATVLKSGGDYGPEHVRQIRDGAARHLAQRHRFVCLTDEFEGADYECLPLAHGWRGWWSKIELFRPGLFEGPTLFLDLDTIIVGPIDDIAGGHRWTMLENFWSRQRVGSGLMAWDGSLDLVPIYRRFRRDPAGFMRECTTKDNWGDQGFIRHNWPEEPARWQARHPGRVVSFKMHCKAGVPEGASIVCFHGQPRPWTTSLWPKA